MKKIALPDQAEDKWIRQIQGDNQILVINYSSFDNTHFPSAGSDSDTTVVNFATNTHVNHPTWSAAVHNDLLYLSLVGSRSYAVSRISGPWWMATGDQFYTNINNLVTFTVSEKGSNTVSLTAEIYQTSGGKKVMLDWNPPYLDVHQNSLMHIPFDYNSYRVGNNLDYVVDFSDKNFHEPMVFHNKEVNVVFNDPKMEGNKIIQEEVTVTNQASIQFVPGGGAATVSYGSKMNIYQCDVAKGALDCDAINKAPINIKGAVTELFQDSAFGSATVQAYANTFANGGTKKDGTTLIFVNFYKDKNVHTYTVPTYAANDVAFTTDSAGNLYVALSYLQSEKNIEIATHVDIYMVDPLKPKTFTLHKTLSWLNMDVTNSMDFCPTQVEFDPASEKELHILSDCSVKGRLYTSNKIYSYTIGQQPESSAKEPVSFDVDPTAEFQGVAKFCPFGSNFIVYSLQANAVVVIDKTQTLTHYTIPLKDYGLTNLSSFDCMSNVGMYAIGGNSEATKDAAPTYNYGIFWGNVGYNEQKFVNTLFQDKDPKKFQDAKSYGIHDFVVTVGFDTDGKEHHTDYSIIQTLAEPPHMWVETNDFSSQTTPEVTSDLKITATNDWIHPMTQTKIVTVKQDMTTTTNVIKSWNPKTEGTVFVESFTELMGPITDIAVKGGVPAAITFVDRKKMKGQFAAKTHGSTIFTEFRGSIEFGVGMTQDRKNNKSTISIVIDEDIKTQFDLSMSGAFDFTNLKQQKNHALIVLNMATSNGEGVHAISIDEEKTAVNISDSNGTRADKIRMAGVTGNRYIAVGLDSHTEVMTTWEVKLEEGKLTFDVIDVTAGVRDFDLSTDPTRVFNFYVMNEDSSAYYMSLTPSTKGFVVSDPAMIKFDENKPYWLESIACANNGHHDGAHVAINTIGTVLYAFDITFPKTKLEQMGQIRNTINAKYETYQKFAGFDGSSMFLDEEFIVHRAFNLKTGGTLTVVADVYARTGKHMNLFSQIQINHGQHSNEVIRDHIKSGKSLLAFESSQLMLGSNFGTMAMSYYQENTGTEKEPVYKGVVAIGSGVKNTQLDLYYLRNSFSIVNKPTSDTDFTQYTIVTNGGSVASGFNLEKLLDGTTPTPTSSSSSSTTGESSASQTGSETGSGSSPEPTDENSSIWVFLGILILLIVMSVGWFAYAQSKDHELEDEEGIYKSIDPSSKLDGGSQFETGLNPDEDGDDALN